MSSFLVGCRKRTRGCSAVTCVTLSCVGLMLLAAHDPPKEAKSTQEVASAGIEATVQQLAWISGAWDGKGLGGTVEEHWTKPGGGSLVGVFRLIGADDKMQVCELLMIEQRGKHVVYSFRHFGPGNKPWEELDKPLVFDLIRLTPNEAVFESSVQTDPKRLTYTRTDDTLAIRVQGETDGVLGDGFTLNMKRTKLGA
ncbi:MAG: hypothetical protein IIA33_05790 [Planctomycetes bacterium]|nr:hypothetical protein [Planctomycetota bacterium]